MKVIWLNRRKQGEIPLGSDFQKASPAEHMALLEFNNLPSSLLCFISLFLWTQFYQLCGKKCHRTRLALHRRTFIFLCLTNVCAQGERKGGSGVLEWLTLQSWRNVPVTFWWKAAPCQCSQPQELLCRLLWDETAKEQMQMDELDKQKHPLNKDLARWIHDALS